MYIYQIKLIIIKLFEIFYFRGGELQDISLLRRMSNVEVLSLRFVLIDSIILFITIGAKCF